MSVLTRIEGNVIEIFWGVPGQHWVRGPVRAASMNVEGAPTSSWATMHRFELLTDGGPSEVVWRVQEGGAVAVADTVPALRPKMC